MDKLQEGLRELIADEIKRQQTKKFNPPGAGCPWTIEEEDFIVTKCTETISRLALSLGRSEHAIRMRIIKLMGRIM